MWVEIDRRMAEITGAEIGENYRFRLHDGTGADD